MIMHSSDQNYLKHKVQLTNSDIYKVNKITLLNACKDKRYKQNITF